MIVQNKHVLVVGLARSGFAVARALARRGAVVTVTDRKPPAEFREVLPQLIKDKVGVELGSQRVETFLRHDVIVISPGVPWDLPQLKAARQRGIAVYPEVEAASWFLEGTVVGITGSNGKTTTTALLGDMLRAAGFPTFVGGNIGNALSLAVDHAQPGTRFVTELSSFQLEGINKFHPHVAVMLNLSPNHLDRHPSLEAYAHAKQQIFRNQGAEDFAVLNADDPWVAGLQTALPSRPVLFSRHRELPNGVFLSEGKVYYRTRHLERTLFETRDVTLRGDFNLDNVLAATAAACVLGADFAAIRKSVRAFKAVEHRLQFVREIRGVDFYNNSKATSVDATLKTLEAFDHGVHLIMGGKDKGAPYTPLVPLIKERVRDVLLIGAAAPVIAEQLAGSTELIQAGELATAVNEAFVRSRPGDVVLLAPACSSFDQFKDYEERGRTFMELVKRLAKDVKAGKVARRKVEQQSGVRGPESGVRKEESGVRSPEPRVGSPESGINKQELEVRAPESGILNLESGIGTQEPRFRSQEPGAQPPLTPTPSTPPAVKPAKKRSERPAAPVEPPEEKQVAASEAATPTVTSEPAAVTDVGAQGPAPSEPPVERLTEPTAEEALPWHPMTEGEGIPVTRPEPPHHIELNYVYEVDAAEMPELESQVPPEDVPVISVSKTREEALDDEALPFETRPGEKKN